MAPKGKCTFQSDGLFQIEFKSWVKKVTNNVFNARCTLCNIEFNLSSMGSTSTQTDMSKSISGSRDIKKHFN